MNNILRLLVCVAFLYPVSAMPPQTPSMSTIKDAFLEPDAVQDLYQMLKDTIEIFDRAGIKYVAVGGTTLGMIRHGGVIPWDDDVDLTILHEDEPKLINVKPAFDALGYHFTYDTNKAVMYCISKKGNPSLDSRPNLTFPFIDIFVMHQDVKTKRFVYSNWMTRDYFPDEWYSEDAFFPFKMKAFGPLMINCINKPEWYLTHYYGATWKTEGHIVPRHFQPKHSETFKIKFSDYPELLLPALPSKPLQDRVKHLDAHYFE